jgi:transposase
MATRRDLTLHEKLQRIFDNNEGNGLSQRKLSGKCKISLGSVSNILKRKNEYLNDYKTNQNQNVKRKFKNEYGQQLDDQVYEWFVQQRSKGILISGPILQQKAVEISESFGECFGSFKDSNGWLEKFRQRHNISYNSVCGESSWVDVVSVQDWMQRISKIITEQDLHVKLI